MKLKAISSVVCVLLAGGFSAQLVIASPYRRADIERLIAPVKQRSPDEAARSRTVGDPPIQIGLRVVAEGLTAPLYLTHAGDGSGRLFIVDQVGFIRVVDANDVLLPVPFLDLTSLIVSPNAFFDERGVLGLAFHPNYASNGRFFVRYSAPRAGDPSEPCNNPGGFIV